MGQHEASTGRRVAVGLGRTARKHPKAGAAVAVTPVVAAGAALLVGWVALRVVRSKRAHRTATRAVERGALGPVAAGVTRVAGRAAAERTAAGS